MAASLTWLGSGLGLGPSPGPGLGLDEVIHGRGAHVVDVEGGYEPLDLGSFELARAVRVDEL